VSDADSYLQNNLMCEAVDTGPYSPVRGVQARIHPIIAEWAANFLQSVSVSGSLSLKAQQTRTLTGRRIQERSQSKDGRSFFEEPSPGRAVIRGAVFELPNAQRREQKRFGASERAGGHSRFELAVRLSGLAITAAIARTFVRLRFFDAMGSRLAHRRMPAIIHKVSHTRAASTAI